MRFLDTPHPLIRVAHSRPLPQGERLSFVQNVFLHLTQKESWAMGMDTSPLVGEVARRAGEGYFTILQNLKSHSRLVYLLGIVIFMNMHSTLRAEPGVVVAASSFFQRKVEGWHWYQDSNQSPVISNQNSLREKKVLSPTQAIETQRKNLETKLHTAIVEPTQENLIAYITAQKALMDQSQKFSEMWKQVVMTTPSLDETLIHPVDQNARHIYYTERHQHLEKQIKKLASEYGLFFFFRKNCPYCHQFAPVVKRFSQKYGWSVLPISLDGGTLPEFPQAKQNNGIAERLNISHVPALIALHPKTGQLIPLAYGLVSESEIEQRVELLTRLSKEAKQ